MLEPATAAAVGRRSLLRLSVFLALGGTGMAGLTGCGTTATTGTAGAAARGVAAPGARTDGEDDELLDAALRATEGALADLRSAARRSPGLAPRLAPAIRVHEAHREVLLPGRAALPSAGARAPRADPLPRTRGRERTLALLAGREAGAAVRLSQLAVAAASGPFARLLASVSAAAAALATGLAAPAGEGEALVVSSPALPDAAPGDRPLPGALTADGAVPVLQDVLAAEHAAVWTLEVLGARTSRSARPDLAEALLAAHAAHRDRRDLLASLLRALDADPVAAAASYVLPASATPAQVEQEAWQLESACGGWWAALVSASTDATRALAVAALQDTAIRGLAVRGSPEIFPGADELADR